MWRGTHSEAVPHTQVLEEPEESHAAIAVQFNVDITRMSEMHYLKQTWDETKPPAWLLYFVCRSLLCWQIYEMRLAGSHQRSNNLLQVLETGGHLPRGQVVTLAAVVRSNTMVANLLKFASDRWPPALEQPEVQQQLFQWDGLDLVKSHAVVDFLAELSGRKLVILSATNELLHTSADAPLDWPTVAIRCGHTDYSIQRRRRTKAMPRSHRVIPCT